MPKLIITKRCQPKDIKKAQKALCLLEAGTLHPRKTNKHGYLTLPCGDRIRLLSTDGGNTYELLTHQQYNRAIDKK